MNQFVDSGPADGACNEESTPGENVLVSDDTVCCMADNEQSDAVWGVIYNSVATLRAEPRYGAELVSQGLLGMPVRVLEKRGGWRRVQTPEKYMGWVNGSVRTMTKEELLQYLQQPRIVVTSLTTESLERPDADAHPVSDLVAGNMLVLRGTGADDNKAFYHAEYPDGRLAYIRKTDAMEYSQWLQSRELTGEAVVQTAFRMKGIPYLWGGTSPKGMDCSGFTKTVYFLHGIILPRDASQQIHCGVLTDSSGGFEEALPGDLLFFGNKADKENPKEKVVHVGIYIGQKRFIHASDYIHVGSFDPSDPLYDSYNVQRYLRTKRIIGQVGTPGIEPIPDNEFYQ